MGDSGSELKEDLDIKQCRKIKEPSSYKVFLLNDDYTTMDFVVYILEEVFHKPSAEAIQVMLRVHEKGMGLCGTYTREIAETKVSIVHELAKKNSSPLKCIMEQV